MKKSIRKNSKPVHQFNLNGTLLNTYQSPAEAAECLNLRRENISQCCRLKKKSHGGFIWSYNPTIDIENYIHEKRDFSKVDFSNNTFVKKRKKIKVTNLITNKFEIIDSMKEASIKYGKSIPSICKACKGTSISKGNLKFEYYGQF